MQTNTDWYAPLRALIAKGALADKATCLADLHTRRQAHEGQFFTPEAVSRYIGRLLDPSITAALDYRGPEGRISVLDTSIGSGRLLAWCDPRHHYLAGFDIDADAVEQVAAAAQAAGFEHAIRPGRLEKMRARHFDVCLINPPFGLHFESALLEPFPCNSFGRFGPRTSAVSHAYALAQALAAARIVVALLPRSFADEVHASEEWNTRLQAVIDLPANTFRDEGANVATALCVFGALASVPAPRLRLRKFDECPPTLALPLDRYPRTAELHSVEVHATEPTITLPVTGNRTVRVARAGRRVILTFACGLTEARTRNAVLRNRLPAVERHEDRRPVGIDYMGQGQLDIEVYLAQPNPVAAWRAFVQSIRLAGAVPQVDPGIEGFLRRRHRRNGAIAVPLQHTIRAAETAAGQTRLTLSAQRRQLLDPTDWKSPLIEQGATLTAERMDNGSYQVNATKDRSVVIDERALRKRFDVVTTTAGAEQEWQVLHAGRAHAFPDRAAAVHRRIRALGIDQWFDWAYQLQDLVELCTVPCNAIVAWDPALGKTRLAAALACMGQGRSLVVVEPHVLDQYAEEIRSLPLPEGFCKVIRSRDDLASDATLLLISYNRLRLPICPGAGRRTYAHALRHRVTTVIADEGHRLGNHSSDQTRAIWHLSAKRRYALTGTPIQNLPRDSLWIAAWLGGDGTVLQPYGIHRPYLDANLIRSTVGATRGVDRFREAYVTTEWVTNEFSENMKNGAKREIPVLKNEAAFREWIAPMLLRRVKAEPAVAPYFKQVAPTIKTISVAWDRAHLAAYIETAETFAQWYKDARKEEEAGGKRLNLTLLLARIGAVGAAANRPHAPYKNARAFMPTTSKQRAIVERIDTLVKEQHTVLLFSVSPAVVTRLDRLLRARGHDPVMLHGNIAQADRTRAIRERVQTRQAKIILATYGTAKTGLNLPQADRVILADRGWTPLLEEQAIQRVMRCQQSRPVEVEIYELAGSLDAYQRQMVEAKQSANASAIDGRAQEANATFLHYDTILGRFIEALAERAGFTRGEWREQIKNERKAA